MPRPQAPPSPVLEAPAPKEPAAIFRLDPWRRGRSAYQGPASLPRLAWRTRIGGVISASPTVGADGTIYVGTQGRHLAAVEPTGKVKWLRRLPAKIWSTAALAADGATLYVGAEDDKLHAFEAATGKPRWALTLGSCPVSGAKGRDAVRCDVDSSPVVGPDGTIFVGGDGLFAVSPKGVLLWHYPTGDRKVHSSPALYPDGTLVVGSRDGRVHGVDAKGQQKWVYAVGSDVDSTPALGADGTIYVGADDGRLLALRHDGSFRWALVTGGPVRSAPALGADGTIYASSHDGKLYAVAPDGKVRWVFPTPRRIESSPVVDAAGRIYVASQDRHLYALDPTGTLLWRYRFPEDVDSTLAVGSTGTLHVGCDDGHLYTLK